MHRPANESLLLVRHIDQPVSHCYCLVHRPATEVLLFFYGQWSHIDWIVVYCSLSFLEYRDDSKFKTSKKTPPKQPLCPPKSKVPRLSTSGTNQSDPKSPPNLGQGLLVEASNLLLYIMGFAPKKEVPSEANNFDPKKPPNLGKGFLVEASNRLLFIMGCRF